MASERVLESLANRLLNQDSIIENNGDNLAVPDTYEFDLSMHKKKENTRKTTISDIHRHRFKILLKSIGDGRQIMHIPAQENFVPRY